MDPVATWEEWSEVHARLELWEDEVRAICRSHGVDVSCIESAYPGTHAVFFVNDALVLKIFCPIRYNSYALELQLHEGPLRHTGLCPPVRFHGTSAHGYDYIAFERFRGAPFREADLGAFPEQTVRDLAHRIAALQAATLTSADHPFGPRCLVHYDLTDDHVYIDEQGRLEGIIDWGDARITHPTEEFPVLFVACFGCDDGLITAFRDTYDAASSHYQINDHDLAVAIQAHPFRNDILGHLGQRESCFSQEMRKLLSERDVQGSQK